MDRNMRNQNSLSSALPKRPLIQQRESLAQHDELIRYIHEAWHKVTEQGPHGGPEFYKAAPEARLAGFQPFDLERWWGRRVVQNIHNISRGHQ